MNPYVFFVGCPRSGTTLLQRIGNAHPLLAVLHETRWITRLWEERIGVTPDGFVTPEMIEELPRQSRFKVLRMNPEDLRRVHEENPNASYAEFVTALFDYVGVRRAKQLVGDKTPAYVRRLPTLHTLWPTAKFVHIIRDGRDVWLSVREWGMGPVGKDTWDDDQVATTGFWWELNVRLGREAARMLGPSLYYELRYEALVERLRSSVRKLCAFLGLRYDAAMLEFHEGRTREEPQLDAKKAWRPVTPGLRDWQSEMTPHDLASFEAAAGDLLDELGYPRSSSPLSPEEIDRARQLRQAYADQVRARQRPVPEGWGLSAA